MKNLSDLSVIAFLSKYAGDIGISSRILFFITSKLNLFNAEIGRTCAFGKSLVHLLISFAISKPNPRVDPVISTLLSFNSLG